MVLPLPVMALEHLGLLPGILLLPCALAVIVVAFILTERVSDHFVDGLESFSSRFRIPQTVVGASVAAIGSSMPELATHVNAVAAGNTEIGIGTIVGSAIFNLCIIIGASAWVRRCRITRSVVYRDGMFYLASVALLLFIVVDDGFVIQWWEPFLLIAFYLLYLGYLFRDARGMDEELGDDNEDLGNEKVGDGGSTQRDRAGTAYSRSDDGEDGQTMKAQDETADASSPGACGVSSKATPSASPSTDTPPPELTEEEQRARLWAEARDAALEAKAMGGLSLQHTMLFVVGGVVGIMVLASYIVWSALVITGELGWSESIFALLFIAIGTSIPDLFTSVQAARKGLGGLAISNAIGSNTFDICVAIGLPLMLLQLWGLTSTEVEGALGASMFYLLVTLVVSLVLLRRRWLVGRREAVILIAMYLSFIPVLLLENEGYLPSWG